MKKVISIIMSVFLLFNMAAVAFAGNNCDIDDYTTLACSEVKSLKNDLEKTNMSKEEKADAFFASIGMEEKWIKSLSLEKKANLYDSAETVGKKTEYCIEKPNGEIIVISKSEYQQEARRQAKEDENILSITEIDSGSNTVTDSYFEKTILWISSKDIPGYYAVFVMYSWLSPPINRGTDVVVLSASSGAFESGSSGCIFVYKKTYTVNNNGNITVTTEEVQKDYDENGDNFIANNNVVYKINLPNNVYLNGMSLTHSDIGVMIFSGYNVTNPQLITNFTLYGNYFHRVVCVGVSFGISGSGPSVSISPSSFFKQYSIPLSVVYRPN
ncbi:MAG: hypothetical protein BWY46_00980 [Firmicutes bacterium ADurb.Bin300]|nr:MAG: hypothetical protein BWY46_00980 [Firmicutes bacterium ADurb.Bin300]